MLMSSRSSSCSSRAERGASLVLARRGMGAGGSGLDSGPAWGGRATQLPCSTSSAKGANCTGTPSSRPACRLRPSRRKASGLAWKAPGATGTSSSGEPLPRQ